MCVTSELRLIVMITFGTFICPSRWTHFEDFCTPSPAPCCGVQRHQLALHRAHALGLGSAGEPCWKQIGKTQNKEVT